MKTCYSMALGVLGRLGDAVKHLIPSRLVTCRLGARYRNSVLLTFDDGPDPIVTPAVLNLLREYGARAVFFIVGRRIERAPGLLLEILEQGHLIGNHSYLHANGAQPGFREYRADLLRCQEAIAGLTRRRPRLFRPPLGTLSPSILLAAATIGLRLITWSVDAADWQCRRPEEGPPLGERIAGQTQSRDILHFHDDCAAVPTALEVVLPTLRSLGMDLRRGVESL